MKKFRILSICPDIYTDGIAVSVQDRFDLAARLQEELGGLIELEQRFVAGGSESIEYMYDVGLAVPYICKLAKDAEAEGFDAIVIDCFLDPGLTECRELVDIPVCGGCISSVFTAARLAPKFSVISTLAAANRCIRENIRKYGLEGSLASLRTAAIPVVALHDDPNALINKMTEEAYKAVTEDGAEVVVFGCTCMFPAIKPVREALKARGIDVPIVEPYTSALYDALYCCLTNVSHSKHAYVPVTDKLRKVDFEI